jgi:small subunit ribosomal protein S14
MAKTSQIYRDRKREKLIAKYAERRAELRKLLKDPSLEYDDKMAAQRAMDELPRNSCPTRLTRRCRITGRSHAVYRKYQLSRIMFRQLALEGKIPGVTKSSW